MEKETERPGRPPRTPKLLWKAGDVFLPRIIQTMLDTPLIRLGRYGVSDLNGWSVLHFVSGGVLKIIGCSPFWSVLTHSLWEAFQILIGMSDLRRPGEWTDVAFDTVFFYLGYLSFRKSYN